MSNKDEIEYEPLQIEDGEDTSSENHATEFNQRRKTSKLLKEIGIVVCISVVIVGEIIGRSRIDKSASQNNIPTYLPSLLPSTIPSMVPSSFPSRQESEVPSSSPSLLPSDQPSTSAPTPIAQEENYGNVQSVVKKGDGKMYNVHGEKLFHNKNRFTQGLTYSRHSDMLFESAGLYGKSSLCKLDPYSMEELKCIDMDRKYFAEGMQVYGEPGQEKLIQITWKSQDGFIYDADSLEVIRQFRFTTDRNQGWGICHDAKNREFIVSDGSQYLHFWDEDSLQEKRRVAVTRLNGDKARDINELEFVKGLVLANVWHEDVILVIDPVTGTTLSEYNFSDLFPHSERRQVNADVLNGISVSKDEGILYITGKKWDRMFQIALAGF
ncbi:gamma glutamin cyclotransferase [Chaetoceros tenuissimus]|uniref:Gamma glutamin cyclotransferase n=1 Tax=Chaetoceros tenuissimus TaxID=426638 RepID=A0AAD3H7I8_9STRA|nr:gamma glutamin cyclotransferase [Chaetoceros tenuissimus]